MCDHLLSLGYQVTATYRRGGGSLWRLEELGIVKRVNLHELDLTDPSGFERIFRENTYDEVYHLAANSFVMDSMSKPALTLEVNTVATAQLLEAIRWHSPRSRLFLASSSEIFSGLSGCITVTEQTLPRPTNPYGASKLAASQMGDVYRQAHGVHVVNGILFNHESEYRGRQFVSRKLAFNLAKYELGLLSEPFALGNLDSARDFSSAKEVVRAIHLSLQYDVPEDFIIASGKVTTIRDLVMLAASSLDGSFEFEKREGRECLVSQANGEIVCFVDEALFRTVDDYQLAGDASKLEDLTGWSPQMGPDGFMGEMVRADIERIRNGSSHVH